jgi:hypothetical protein
MGTSPHTARLAHAPTWGSHTHVEPRFGWHFVRVGSLGDTAGGNGVRHVKKMTIRKTGAIKLTSVCVCPYTTAC